MKTKHIWNHHPGKLLLVHLAKTLISQILYQGLVQMQQIQPISTNLNLHDYVKALLTIGFP